MNFIEDYSNTTGQIVGLYLSVAVFILIFVSLLSFVPFIGQMLATTVAVTASVLAIFAGYFIYANSEETVLKAAGILQIISGLFYFTFILIPLGLIFNFLSIVLQIISHFGLIKYLK